MWVKPEGPCSAVNTKHTVCKVNGLKNLISFEMRFVLISIIHSHAVDLTGIKLDLKSRIQIMW